MAAKPSRTATKAASAKAKAAASPGGARAKAKVKAASTAGKAGRSVKAASTTVKASVDRAMKAKRGAARAVQTVDKPVKNPAAAAKRGRPRSKDAPTPKRKAVAKSPKRVPEASSRAPAGVASSPEDEESEPRLHEEDDEASAKAANSDGKKQPPVWGPFWSYSQCSHTVDEDSNPKNGIIAWPGNVVPEEGKWVYWLPQGWGQGVKTTAGGKTLKVYVSPGGKVFYHKVDVQSVSETKLREKDAKTPHGDVDLETFRPSWPKRDWLPKDWFICYKKLPNRLLKCFITPDQSGYAYHKFSVLDYLSGKTEKLTPVSGKIIIKDDTARTLNFTEN